MNVALEAGIRAAVLADAPSLAGLHAESFGAESWSVGQMEGSLRLATTQGWIVMDGGTMAGFILCQVTLHEKEVLAFCVRPCARRKGLGMKLLKHAMDTEPAKDMQLEVAADNEPARRLYERCGFSAVYTRVGYYRRGPDAVDAIRYRKTGIRSNN